MNGGALLAEVLLRQRVKFLFTLCGGHISPILVESKRLGVRVVDVRHEADAVFAADAVARLTGVPGVAAVTAGPGVTNTLTAIKNAQLAQSPLVLLGGAAATLLQGRGALQDIDQMALMAPHVKQARTVRRAIDLPEALGEAFRLARSGVPGPVFLECPVDLLYDEGVVREWYQAAGRGKGLAADARRWYLKRHAARLFEGLDPVKGARAVARAVRRAAEAAVPEAEPLDLRRAAQAIARAERPLLLLGSQAVLEPGRAAETAAAVEALGMPVYLAGGTRGLLGAEAPLQRRHQRREALKEADLVLLAGVACDFRLDYGSHIGRRAALISVNRSERDLLLNRKPTLPVLGDPGRFLRALASESRPQAGWTAWLDRLRQRDEEREAEIARQSGEDLGLINPIRLCREIDRLLAAESCIVADGGDFVGTAAYVLRPRKPLSWLDPGVFGTLGVGGGFALGAKLCRPEADVWVIYGDGSAAYSLAEFDTFARHGVPVIAVVGNDAGWTQIAREQVPMLGDAVGTELAPTDYHRVAEGYGGRGFLLERPEDVPEVLAAALAASRAGSPVLVNARIGRSEFRKGSLSM